ncbi:phage tail sheath C-terminal domain-containing protein [Dysosmobacter sp.]|uniref:phage tail sheath C-terminal domain-containing protein n=1 Tax=Dysosmobacter sp. TaxID=2591382 RepID=UPI003A8DE198
MSTNIGLPSLTIAFQKAAQATANRSKKGFVGLFVRDTQEQGVHQLTSAALIPTKLGVDNQNYIKRAFAGTDRGVPSKVVAVVIAPGTEDTTALEDGLKLIENQTLDYIAPPPDVTEDEKAVLETWVKGRREKYFTEKLVEPNPATPPDHMGIISFTETDDALAEGTTTYAAAEYSSRIAGVLAGTPQSMSATNAALEELTAVTPRSEAEQIAAINAGNLILIHDGQVAKIARAVNSLTTIPTNGSADWCKIKIVEGMDLITYYLRTTVQNQYLGRYPNTYDNKCLLITAILEYLQYLEGAGVLNPGESWCEIDLDAQTNWLKAQGVEVADLTEQEIREYQTGSWVFIRCGGRLVDAMEDFQVTFNTLVTVADLAA